MSIKKNFIFNSLLTVTQLLSPLITYPYILRILSPSNIGVISFAQNLSGYFMVFAALGVNIYGQREIAIYKNDLTARSKIFYQILIIHILTTIFALLIYLIVIFSFDRFKTNITFFLLSILPILLNPFSVEWFFRGLEKFKYITIYSIIVRIFFVIAIFVFIKTQMDILKYYIIIILSIIIPSIVNIFYAGLFVKFKKYYFDTKQIINHIRELFATSLYVLLTNFYTTFPIIALGFLSSDSEVGYYTIADKLIRMFISVFTAFSMVMFPRMSTLQGKENELEFNSFITKSILVVVPVAVFSSVFVFFMSSSILQLFAGKSFNQTTIVLQILSPLILVIPLAQVYVNQILLPKKNEKSVLKYSLVSALIGIGLNIILIPILGSKGSAASILISEISMTIFASFAVFKLISLRLPTRILVENFILSLSIPIVIWIVNMLTISLFLKIVIVSLITATIFIIYQIKILKNSQFISLLNNGIEIFAKSNLTSKK